MNDPVTIASESFGEHGPFDTDERAAILAVIGAVSRGSSANKGALLANVQRNIHRLERIGEVLAEYPSSFSDQALGNRRRGLQSLVDSLSRSTPSNFDMFLPTRALVSRTLVIGEMNFYRMLRFVMREGLEPDEAAEVELQVDRLLCRCLYTRLAEMVLIDIASDETLQRALRNKAALGLMQIWEQTTYRVSDFFPVLEATWDARRRVPATLGTLMGTSEMFQLIEAGCDEQFVDYLVRDDHTDDEEAAFREFLFGTTTEELARIEAKMAADGTRVISAQAAGGDARLLDACRRGGGDPAVALFEFFLYRHLQAAARRQAGLPGPKRTAEEYVMIHYLKNRVDAERLSLPPE
jgi:hypothetical protein